MNKDLILYEDMKKLCKNGVAKVLDGDKVWIENANVYYLRARDKVLVKWNNWHVGEFTDDGIVFDINETLDESFVQRYLREVYMSMIYLMKTIEKT